MYKPYPRQSVFTLDRLLLLLLAVVLALTALLVAPPLSQPTPAVFGSITFAPDFEKLPLSFVPNTGQADPAVRFQAHSMGGTLLFTPDEVVLALPAPSPADDPEAASLISEQTHKPQSEIQNPLAVLRLRFEGANPTPEIVVVDPLPGIVNYFIGSDPAKWRTDLPTYAGIVYEGLYPGIDLRYTGIGGLLKGTYLIAPGADPAQIHWHYEGAASVRVDEASGDLLITLPPPDVGEGTGGEGHTLTERAPVAYQTINGQRVSVAARYTIAAGGSIGFALGDYDSAYPLTLDPTLVYSTYLGGSSYDSGYGIAVDSTGNAYVVGMSYSSDFVADIYSGDAFVVKLNPTGSAIVYSSYLGGTSFDKGLAIAVDNPGNAYVTGNTSSTDFPTVNPLQPAHGGGTSDAFVAKLNSTGSALVYSTYLGGNDADNSQEDGIAVDGAGSAYVAGWTISGNFTTTTGAFTTTLAGSADAFVAKVNAAGSALAYATYLGGSKWDGAYGIAVDAAGNAYVTGGTMSGDFPTTAGAFDTEHGEYGTSWGGDAFVTKLNASGSALVYSTFLGGTDDDEGVAVAVDASGRAYVTGNTESAGLTYPFVLFPGVNPFQSAYGGGDRDAFVTKLNAAGSALVYSSFLGGGGADYGTGIAVEDGENNAYLTGYTDSTDFPTVNPIQGAYGGGTHDAFVTMLSAAGSVITYSTYLGGAGNDEGAAIAVDALGNAYVTGNTESSDFPTASFDETYNGSGDAFVAKIDPRIPTPTPTATPCPGDISVTALEITQGIQNKANDIPLVIDRRTVARAYVKGYLVEVGGVRARLRAFDVLANELSGSPIRASNVITVHTDGGDRLDIDDSFWFEVPKAWTSFGLSNRVVVTFTVEINYDNAVPECNTANNTLEEEVIFRRAGLAPPWTTELNLKMVPLHLHDQGDRNNDVLIYDDTVPAFPYLLFNIYRFHPISRINWWTTQSSLYPISHDTPIVNHEWDLRSNWDQGEMLLTISWANFFTLDSMERQHWVGMVHPSVSTDDTLGLGQIASWNSWSKMDNISNPPWRVVGGATMAHELGHNKGLKHVLCTGTEEDDPGDAEPYPWPYPDCQLADVDEDGYYGFDVYYKTFTQTRKIPPTVISNDPALTVTNQTAFPLMGYKAPEWVSPYEYCKLLLKYGVGCTLFPPPLGSQSETAQEQLEEAVTTNPLAYANPDELRALQAATEYIAAGGLISVTAGTAEFRGVYQIDNPFPDALQQAAEKLGYRRAFGPQAGQPYTYTLVQANAGGQVLDSHDIYLGTEDGSGNVQSFLELVPLVTDTTRVQIRRDATVLAERVASANPPTVQLLAPNGGEQLGPGATVSWSASDLDGDELTFNVLYSADNGQTWRLVRMGLISNTFQIPSLADLPGSNQGRMRVMANDGFHTAQDDSDGAFSVPGSPPLALILQPTDGITVETDSLVMFYGIATDVEDGPITGTQLLWHSDLDGDLGTGEELALDTLSSGEHQIAFTAADSDGETTSITNTLYVVTMSRRVYLPLVLKDY